MNYSDENEKPPSGFKDIEVHDSPKLAPSAPSYNYPESFQNPPPYQPPPPIDNQANLDMISRLETIEMHARLVKWTSLVLSIFSFLFLLPGTFPLIITFVFPILGFVGAHKYNECMAKFYTIYLILINIVQIIVMGVIGGVAYIVFQCLVMVAELVILFYNVKLTKELQNLPKNEKKILQGEQARNFR